MFSFLHKLVNSKIGLILKSGFICLVLSGGCDLQATNDGIGLTSENTLEDTGSGFEDSGSGFEESGSVYEDAGS